MYMGLHFNGYKSFPDSRTTSLMGIKHCNVIIEKNNSGKSSLLDAIAASVDIDYSNEHGYKFRNLEATFAIDNASLEATFVPSSEINGIHNPLAYAQENFTGQPIRVIVKQFQHQKVFSTAPNGNDIFHSSPLGHMLDIIVENISHRERNMVFRRISAERNISPEAEGQDESLGEDGRGASNLIRKFINHSEYDETLIERELLNALNSIMRPEIDFEEIKIQQIVQNGEMLWEIFLREKGYGRYALSQSGSGLKTVVLVLLNLLVIPRTRGYSNKAIVYGFEELENNLHPAMQRRLFDYIYTFSVRTDTYVFLTTHSHIAINAFFDREEATIYHVAKGANGSVVKKIDNYIDKIQILDDLDVKASDLLQSNGIIWVEGPSDRIYIKHWLKIFCDCEFVEGRDYQFMYYGGRLLSHYSTEQAENLISILTTNRNAAIIMDSDKQSRQEPINETKKRIQREFSEHGMFSWITKGKEIENYIPAIAIIKSFGCNNVVECGQYELFPKYIARIYSNFSSQKVPFANALVANITAENSKEKLDLEAQVRQLYNQIQKWNI